MAIGSPHRLPWAAGCVNPIPPLVPLVPLSGVPAGAPASAALQALLFPSAPASGPLLPLALVWSDLL